MNVRLDPGQSAKRPANPWFWSAVAALLVLAVWGLFALTSRPHREATPKTPEPVAVAPTPAPAAVPVTPPVAKPVVRPAPVNPPPAPPTAPVVTPRPPPAPPASTQGLLREAQDLQAADNYQAAREKLQALLDSKPDAATQAQAEELLGTIDIGLVLSPRQMPEKTDYAIQPGDTLGKVAQKFGTSIELLMKGNNLTRSLVRVNDRLRVFSGKFTIRVDKSDNTLTLLLNDKFFKRYRVGTGQYNRTPVGTFAVTDKIAQPTWWRADGKAIPYGDPENLLGTHWLAINVPGYGIHGTWDPSTIGKQSSAGCVRLVNSDIEELFTLVPVGTTVIIED